MALEAADAWLPQVSDHDLRAFRDCVLAESSPSVHMPMTGPRTCPSILFYCFEEGERNRWLQARDLLVRVYNFEFALVDIFADVSKVHTWGAMERCFSELMQGRDTLGLVCCQAASIWNSRKRHTRALPSPTSLPWTTRKWNDQACEEDKGYLRAMCMIQLAKRQQVSWLFSVCGVDHEACSGIHEALQSKLDTCLLRPQRAFTADGRPTGCWHDVQLSLEPLNVEGQGRCGCRL